MKYKLAPKKERIEVLKQTLDKSDDLYNNSMKAIEALDITIKSVQALREQYIENLITLIEAFDQFNEQLHSLTEE